jgi:hypothetical protein
VVLRNAITLSQLAAQVVLLVIPLLVSGCASCVDRAQFSGYLAEYNAKVGPHKAMYVNINTSNSGYDVGMAWADASLSTAEATAKERCVEYAQANGYVGQCIPFAVDDRLTGYDISDDFCGSSQNTFQEFQAMLSGANALRAASSGQPAYGAQMAALEREVAALRAQREQNQSTVTEPAQLQVPSGSKPSDTPPSTVATPASIAPTSISGADSASQCNSVLQRNLRQWCGAAQKQSDSVCSSARAEESCFEHAVQAMQGVCPKQLTTEYSQQAKAAGTTAAQVCNN